jgi:superfamily II DNA helicase RecQ
VLSELNAQPKTDTTLQVTYYKVKLIYLPPEKRPEVKYDLQKLPFKNTGGQLPAYDGEHFQVNLYQQQVSSQDEAARMVSQLLQSLNSPLQMNKELKMKVNITTSKSDENYVDQKIREGIEATKKKLSGEIKDIGKSTDEYLEELAAELRKQAKMTVSIYSFAQYLDSILIDNTAINIANRNEMQNASIYGKFYNTVNLTNKITLTLSAAVAKAVTEINHRITLKILKSGEMMDKWYLVPYEDGFKYA